MKRFLLLFFIVFYFGSCINEYDVFSPYENVSINYINQFKSKTQRLTFSNSEKFEYTSSSGFQIEIPANSFGIEKGEINLYLDYSSTLGDIIGNKLNTITNDNKFYSFDKIIKLNFKNLENKEISLNNDSEVVLKVPYEKKDVPRLLFFNNNAWDYPNPEMTNVFKSTWYSYSPDTTLIKGYKIKLNSLTKFALVSHIENEKSISDLRIELSEGFNVSNSLVQLVIKGTSTNISLKWDNNSKTFILPEGIDLPSDRIIVLVFSEDSDKNPYFGMNYAEVKDGDIVKIKLEQKEIKEIKDILNRI